MDWMLGLQRLLAYNEACLQRMRINKQDLPTIIYMICHNLIGAAISSQSCKYLSFCNHDIFTLTLEMHNSGDSNIF